MSKVYFNKIQNTNDKTISKFYFNKNNEMFNNIDFLQNKIKSLLESEKTTDSIKKQLKRLQLIDFAKYDCFFIYSNAMCFGINAQNKVIDFYKNEYDAVVDLQGYNKNYNCKAPSTRGGNNDKIDASDF